MDLRKIRFTIIKAITADELLFSKLVLKGGNALDLAYGVGTRSSIDIDFSIEDDFHDIKEIEERFFLCLKNRFNEIDYVVFDAKFIQRPKNIKSRFWGGYTAEFKLIAKINFDEKNLELSRKKAHFTGSLLASRTFTVDISKYEYCKTKELVEIDRSKVYVYTPLMIVAEKFRAICQQMDDYSFNKNKHPRARDFYDIYETIELLKIDLDTKESLDIFTNIFDIKYVPLVLIANIFKVRDFHFTDWNAVKVSISGEDKGFDFYFEYVVKQSKKLKALWNM